MPCTVRAYVCHNSRAGVLEMFAWIKLVFSAEATLGLSYTALEGNLGISKHQVSMWILVTNYELC